ncbi:hypothetical protein ABZV28_22865 [Streptomyces sp. NPDC004981]|uniref:hypothetical protein n=1 Tax=Streptomyces sp. NPDC004981 TaxID=3156655 RepID=UPI0033A0ABB5
MTAADRMAGFLDRQFRQRVDFDALADVADQGDCNLPCSPGRRQVLTDAADELVRGGLARLPVGQGGWDYSAHPALPRWVNRPPLPRTARARPGPQAWVPQLSGLAEVQLTPGDHALLDPVNALLRDRPDDEVVPVAERSFELYGDEKFLHGIERHRLVTRGVLDLTAHLRARPAPAPLAMFELGPAPWMLIVENSAAFTSLRGSWVAGPTVIRSDGSATEQASSSLCRCPLPSMRFASGTIPWTGSCSMPTWISTGSSAPGRLTVSSGHCLTRDARSVPAAPPPRLREAESWLPPDMASEVFDLLA